MTELCIFDLDGTLLDTVESIRYNLNTVLSRYGIEGITKEETKVFVGNGARKLVYRSLVSRGIDTGSEEGEMLCDRITKKYNALYDSDPFYLTEPYCGIKDAIKELYLRGIKLAVLSNKPDPTVKQLIAKHFGGVFDIVLGATDKMKLKPDPESALYICESLGVSPENTAYFGDTGTDMRTAKNYGAGKTVGVLWGFRGKDELLENGADTVICDPYYIPGSTD